MNTFRKTFIIWIILILGLMLFGLGERTVQVQASGSSDQLATIQIESDRITWQPLELYASLELRVVTPGGTSFTRTFKTGTVPILSLQDLQGLPEGIYTYELRLTPALDAESQAALAAASDDAEARFQVFEKLLAAGKLPSVAAEGGNFTLLDGHFVIPTESESRGNTAAAPNTGTIQPNDIVNADDVIISGGLCTGLNCLTDGTENFGYDTIKLKENNLRIFMDDTSATAGFAANDWRFIFNDTASGGANYFAVEDSTGARIPFRIDAGAPANSLYVNSLGKIGMGTNTPVTKLHLVIGDTPAIRLEQDASGGYTPQVWDVAGNESNFFIRDITNGSKLPFRIQPNAPTSSITVKANGNIGFGTWSPAYSVELDRTGTDAAFFTNRSDGAQGILKAGASSVQIGSVSPNNVEVLVNNTPVMTFNAQGNATLQGALSEYSDVNAKENLSPVDGKDVLSHLAQLPIMTWNYKSDGDKILHMGPMAQDFYAAFSLGADNTHIASLDANGVAIAAIQELAKTNAEQEATIQQLTKKNTSLEARLSSLEDKVNALATHLDSLDGSVQSAIPAKTTANQIALSFFGMGDENTSAGTTIRQMLVGAVLATVLILGLFYLRFRKMEPLSSYKDRHLSK